MVAEGRLLDQQAPLEAPAKIRGAGINGAPGVIRTVMYRPRPVLSLG